MEEREMIRKITVEDANYLKNCKCVKYYISNEYIYYYVVLIINY